MKYAAAYVIIKRVHAGVMELVDVVDSKSTAVKGVPVRVRPPAPEKDLTILLIVKTFFLCMFEGS